MLMTHSIKRIDTQHRWHVALLKHPDTMRIKTFMHLTSKVTGIFQVIEHRERCNNLCLLLTKTITESISREEVSNVIHMLRNIFLKFLRGGINTHELQVMREASKEGSIITSNINDNITRLKVGVCHDLESFLFEVTNHTTVQTRTIPILITIHGGEIKGMLKLNMSTSTFLLITLDES